MKKTKYQRLCLSTIILSSVMLCACNHASLPEPTMDTSAAGTEYETTEYIPAETEPSVIATLTATAFVNRMNVGWNLGDSFDSKCQTSPGKDSNLNQETVWGNPIVTREQIDLIAQSGFNTIRIPVSWYYNSYHTDGHLYVGEEFMKRVGEVIQYALDAGLYVIMNSHHDMALFYTGISDSEFEQVRRDAYDLWHCLADYYKDFDERLIFEGFNEIDNHKAYWQFGDLAAAQMNQLNQSFVDAVRDTGGRNKERVLIAPTLLHGCQSPFFQAYTVPKDIVDDRIIIAVHNYYSLYDQAIDDFFAMLQSYAAQLHAPIIIDEFGSTDRTYSTAKQRSSAAANYVARAATYGIKCIWWDNGYEYALINRRELTRDEKMIEAMLHPVAYTSSYANTIQAVTDFTYEYASALTGEVKYTYWGSLTYGHQNTDYRIPDSMTRLSIALTTRGNASDLKIVSVIFYDDAGNFLYGTEPKYNICCISIPASAKYMRFCINSSHRNIPLSQAQQTDNFTSYFEQGDLRITITMD